MRIYSGAAADNAFKQWMARNPEGYYLNERAIGLIARGIGELMLHRVGCWHLGTGEGVNSTTYAKVADAPRQELLAWPTRTGHNVVNCHDCRPD